MDDTLKAMISPGSVAVIGASEGTDRFGGRVVHYLKKHGFRGRILPVNPRHAVLQGLPCFATIKDADVVPDVAVLAVPAKALLGVKAAILITGMLDEVDSEGENLQDRVLQAAAAGGMRILGPNCLGILNAVDHVALTPSLAMELPALKAGAVGIVSQSGALMGTMIAKGTDFGVGFSRCISVGNQSDLDLCDFFSHLIEDEATRAICLYIEGLKDSKRFFEIARAAHAAGKPVLAVKTGKSSEGAAIGQSHTGSLAGSYDAFVAACRANGVVVAEDPYVMVQAADLLVRLPQVATVPKGVGAIGSSGGSTANFADKLVGGRLRLPQVSAATRRRLEEWIPPADAHIPIDTGAFRGGTSKDGIIGVMEAMLGDDDVSAVVYLMTTSPKMADYAALVPDLVRRTGKPIVFALLAGNMAEKVRAVLREADLPCLENLTDALSALELVFEVARFRSEGLAPPPVRHFAQPMPADVPVGQLTESEAKSLIAAYGIATAREIRVRDASRLQEVEIPFLPAVVKGVSRNILHKSEANIVRIGMKTGSEVRAACADVFRILADKDPSGAEGVSVQEMVIGEAEIFLGARYDPEYGPLVTVGYGGIFVEVLRDVAVAPAPVDPQQAKRMIMGLKLWPLLNGARGRPVTDVDAAADALSRLSWLAADLQERLVEIDVNPVIVKARGQGAVAVDAAAVIGGGVDAMRHAPRAELAA
jgi:acyl-CoA synthetase (NDP forming)